MAKKFDIHKWQAKQWLKQQLKEQDDFTPDLEDDELKRSKVQQMMAKEKENTPVEGGMNQDDYYKVVDILERYSLGEFLDTAVEFYQTGGEDESAELANKFAADFRKWMDSRDEELDEANVTGTGTSISTGDSPAFATPHAFAKNKRKWKGKKATWKEQEEPEMQDDLSLDKLGKDGEIEPDVEYIQNLLDTKINTPEEWTELFHILMSHSLEIKGLTSSQLTTILRKSMQEL